MSIVRRIATFGLALATFAAGDMPGMVYAQTSGKILVMGSIAEPDTFIGGEGGLYGTAVVGNLIYGQPGLVGIDDLLRPVAELATDVPTLDNGGAVMVGDGADQHLETTFHLRQNATFGDGTPVTADDVVFSWKLSLNPSWPAPAGNDLESKYSDVVAVDPNTVVFKMKPGVIHPFYLYGLPDVWIYPSNRLGSLVDFDPQNSPKVANLQSSVYGREPVGAGPYTLVSWDPGIQMVFHARADYYRGKPAIDTIVIRGFGASKQTLIDQLQAGRRGVSANCRRAELSGPPLLAAYRSFYRSPVGGPVLMGVLRDCIQRGLLEARREYYLRSHSQTFQV